MRRNFPNDPVALRAAAARVVERLALSGYNNESIEKVDAWVGSTEFDGDEAGVEAGAYLGEAIIKRHGGKWSFADGAAPQVLIERNGIHIINPFGKVAKRVANGHEDHLISLVQLAGHVTTETKLQREAVLQQAAAALDLLPRAQSVSIGKLLLAVIVVPLVVFIALLAKLGLDELLVAAVGAVVSGVVALLLLAKLSRPKTPSNAPGTLAWEAQLSMDPLSARLLDLASKLGAQPSQKQLEEVAFYAAQMRRVASIVERRDTRPGRGYVGFDTFDKPTSSWPD